ncbi:receptor-interacting serine/threonine-protein kinase 1 isoform X2 [Lampris incognitus]|uniref:receptor-interacting serine/threonine-protein kinase 1 isoform X2 n=1 Tax=Lampris incognitus TaxID=2546036 RepID=UPI0024B5B3A8|nr:receptor-interacting serine/threonine-protein kinase 1 isoform X2 [Lampris incognitus]
MATAPDSYQMRSSDLIKKEPMDYGGFGEVYLCYHKTLGQVVLKTVYTGPSRNEGNKKSLLEEGSLMTRLNHERVVRLLGVIMEDGDYSLVMELIPKGNLLAMLEQVPVPISIKGRIILEITEGMIYLTENHIIHKDLKPENILVDKDFHIKIADLGLATCQTWSKLTKEESRRKSRMGLSVGAGARGAGTLSYMAPEHLESIHARSTERSDVYSFAIVIWVILTGQEPYENARSEDHVCQRVRNGDRPSEDLIPADTPAEMIQLMKKCWQHDPQQRPTFQESYGFFLPFYLKQLEQYVERDTLQLRNMYEGPVELVEKMKRLPVPSECLLTDNPAPLLSSERIPPVPVEASIEDLHLIQFEHPKEPSIQTDAKAISRESALENKLAQELQYHKGGSYTCPDQASSAGLCCPSYSWTKTEPVQPASQEDSLYPAFGLYESMASSASRSSEGHMSTSSSSPTLSLHPQQYQFPLCDRQQSWPFCPVPDTAAPDFTAGHRLTSSKTGSLQDTGGLFIQNASGIQIGHNNTLSIRNPASLHSFSSSPLCNGAANSLLKEDIHKYEDQALTEEHLDLLRDNIGSNWKRCARRLGLTDVEVDTIDHDYSRDGLPEKVHQMLERWRMKVGSIGCTVGTLCKALEGHIKISLIQRLLDTCQSSSS